MKGNGNPFLVKPFPSVCLFLRGATMILHELLIPVKSNSGKTFSRKVNREFSDYVVSLAGGLSELPLISGQWKDHGKIYRESMRPIRVACNKRTIQSIARKAREQFKQLSIMSYTVSNDVTFTV